MAAAVPEAIPQPKVWIGTGKSVAQIHKEIFEFVDTLPQTEQNLRLRRVFFSHVSDVWGDPQSTEAQQAPIAGSDFDAIVRSEEQGSLYANCRGFLNKPASKDSRSSETNQLQNTIKLDALGNQDSEAAHLFPHTEKRCYKAYGFLAEAAVGHSCKPPSGPRRLTTILAAGSPAAKRRKILTGVKGTKSSSLKGHKFNKFYLKDQGSLYDGDDPTMLVIPLLSLDQILDWTRDNAHSIDYDALFIAMGPLTTPILVNAPQECDDDEIELARSNLEHFIKGIASGGFKGGAPDARPP